MTDFFRSLTNVEVGFSVKYYLLLIFVFSSCDGISGLLKYEYLFQTNGQIWSVFSCAFKEHHRNHVPWCGNGNDARGNGRKINVARLSSGLNHIIAPRLMFSDLFESNSEISFSDALRGTILSYFTSDDCIARSLMKVVICIRFYNSNALLKSIHQPCYKENDIHSVLLITVM